LVGIEEEVSGDPIEQGGEEDQSDEYLPRHQQIHSDQQSESHEETLNSKPI
jgi:hypothetical protein